jgi:predicted P-loop ATPase
MEQVVTTAKANILNNGFSPNQVKKKLDYLENGKIVQSIDNARMIIANDYRLAGKIKYNTLAYSTWVFGNLPWDKDDNYREWNNIDDSNLLWFLESEYGIKNTERIMHALTIVATQNKFNPVTEFLESLKWDGKKHIENLLPDYLGVDKNEYSIACMKLFMLGAVSRAYQPGCKFDYIIVLVGSQGCGKSSFLKALSCNDEWFNDNFNTIEGDKATERLRGMWIVELAELLAVKRAQDVEAIKSFITSTSDTYRPPYGRRTEQRPRRVVFAGSTNNTHFLTDRTGNRRYLPLAVSKEKAKKSLFEDKKSVMEDFRQAWAEAMAIYKSGNYQIVLPGELQKIAVDTQNEYLEEDPKVGIIQNYLDSLKKDEVCALEIYRKALNNVCTPTTREINEIHSIMQNSIEGWVKIGKSSRFGEYGVQRGYRRIKEPETEFMTVSDDEQLPFV